MHATVFLGVALGVIGLFILFGLTVTDSGPFSTEVTSADVSDTGVLAVAFNVTNDGDSAGRADCKLTRDGVPRPDDVALRTPEVAAGQTISLEEELTPDPNDPVTWVPELVSVICS
jgi:hypothetical protein